MEPCTFCTNILQRDFGMSVAEIVASKVLEDNGRIIHCPDCPKHGQTTAIPKPAKPCKHCVKLIQQDFTWSVQQIQEKRLLEDEDGNPKHLPECPTLETERVSFINRITQAVEALGGAVIDTFSKVFPERYDWISSDLPAVDLREDPDLEEFNYGDDILVDRKVWRCFPLSSQADREKHGNNWFVCIITGANCYGNLVWDWNYNIEFSEEEVWEAIEQNRELNDHMAVAYSQGKQRKGDVIRFLRETRCGGGGDI